MLLTVRAVGLVTEHARLSVEEVARGADLQRAARRSALDVQLAEPLHGQLVSAVAMRRVLRAQV